MASSSSSPSSSLSISRLSLLLVFTASQLIRSIEAFAQCYYPDGSIPTDYIWEPCTGSQYSSCCIPTEGDICQPNGLCFYPATLNNTFRGTCTDRTWTDPACPKDICVSGQEDTWTWASPCSSDNGANVQYACGKLDEDGFKVSANCSGAATTYSPIFLTQASTTSKVTRYTPPPAVDTKRFTVYTVTYTTKITALVQRTTLTTTWESTFTSAFGQASGAASDGGSISITGPKGGFVTSTPTSSPSSAPSPGGITISPGVLGAAIAGPIVLIALLAGLFFYLRKKRALKNSKGRRISSPSGTVPPANGPVGNDQVTPYEVAATETSAFAPDKKYLYTVPPPSGPNAGSYEMSSGGEKGWGNGGGVGVAEVSAEQHQHQHQNQQQQQHQHQQWTDSQVISPVTPYHARSPAPVYNESGLGPVVIPVELDGGDYPPSRPTTATGRGRNGVGNA